MLTIREFEEKYFGRELDYNKIQDAYRKYFKENIGVGDGVTLCYWSDCEAYTVIKKTKCTLTIQRDKATLKPTFKPEFVAGGFCGTVINQDEQDYDYERDPNGQVFVAHWSERKNGYFVDGCLRVIAGRHEFYDYNF